VKKTVFGIAMITVLLTIMAGGLAACGGTATTTPTQATSGETATAPPQTLPGKEIRQYEGQDLSSINDFRENSIKGPQHVDITSYHLEITGLVENPTIYTYDEVLNDYTSYKKVVELDCVEGWSVNILWQGVQVRDLLQKAVPETGAKVVIFHAYDGYTTSFPIEYIMDNPILMAYKMNDVTIPPERGFPFQLVAESKWGYKWIKWITQIELSDNINYKGYWESRGYSNNGDLGEYFFGP
jgi:DMSO/TMAO reductase YedYZ molybdopterin-dependent catalytic subunit